MNKKFRFQGIKKINKIVKFVKDHDILTYYCAFIKFDISI